MGVSKDTPFLCSFDTILAYVKCVSFVGDEGYNGGNKFKDLVVSGSDVLNY